MDDPEREENETKDTNHGAVERNARPMQDFRRDSERTVLI